MTTINACIPAPRPRFSITDTEFVVGATIFGGLVGAAIGSQTGVVGGGDGVNGAIVFGTGLATIFGLGAQVIVERRKLAALRATT